VVDSGGEGWSVGGGGEEVVVGVDLLVEVIRGEEIFGCCGGERKGGGCDLGSKRVGDCDI